MKPQRNSLLITFTLILSLKCFADDSITITYGNEYKPFAWGEKDIALGVQKDFVDIILGEKLGLKVNHEVCPWKRCQLLVKEGKKDGFFTVATHKRAEYTIKSSIPFYETQFVIHTSKLNPHLERLKAVRSLEDLEKMHDLAHIHMLGSGWHEQALKNMKNVKTIVDSAAIPTMLKLLRADVYIEHSAMLRYQANEKGILTELLSLDENPIINLGWYIFISKKSKHQPLMPKINKMLETLQASGELHTMKMEIFKKYGMM